MWCTISCSIDTRLGSLIEKRLLSVISSSRAMNLNLLGSMSFKLLLLELQHDESHRYAQYDFLSLGAEEDP